MRKITLLLGMVLSFITLTPASAQFKWGVEAGLNMSKVSVKGDGNMFGSDNRTGWFLGPKAQFIIPGIGLGVDGAILYSQKKMKLDYSYEENGMTETGASQDKTLPYIEIPINLRYHIGPSSLVGLYVSTGPQYSWYVGSRSLKFEGESLGLLERSNFSWNVGVGINALSHLQLGFTYNIALGQTGELSGFRDATKKMELKNNSWQVRLAYLF